MKTLILGGTQFLGRHITQACLDAGHEVTLFNRGQTNLDLFADDVAPSGPDVPVQVIDGRDQAAWLVRCIANNIHKSTQ